MRKQSTIKQTVSNSTGLLIYAVTVFIGVFFIILGAHDKNKTMVSYGLYISGGIFFIIGIDLLKGNGNNKFMKFLCAAVSICGLAIIICTSLL